MPSSASDTFAPVGEMPARGTAGSIDIAAVSTAQGLLGSA
jgi:hypothetical protein